MSKWVIYVGINMSQSIEGYQFTADPTEEPANNSSQDNESSEGLEGQVWAKWQQAQHVARPCAPSQYATR